MKDYSRDILALDDTQLEKFVRDWVNQKKEPYTEITTFTGAGDLGRDVVGFLSSQKHSGSWHNYQCKQYKRTVPLEVGICEIGKILYYAYKGNFTSPSAYYFVAPKGVVRKLEGLIFNPDEFKKALIKGWKKYCATKIIDKQTVALSAGLKKFIEEYDFSLIRRLKLDDLLTDPQITPVLFKWFGADPGPAPTASTPDQVQDFEIPYIQQLVGAYGEREKVTYTHYSEVQSPNKYGEHFSRQRQRFFTADVFKKFYRDNTSPETITKVETDIYHGIVETYEMDHLDSLYRVDAVLIQAANTVPSGDLSKYASVAVRQGICHHLANEGKLPWKK